MQDSMDIREEMIRQADRDAAESLTEPTPDPLAAAAPELLAALKVCLFCLDSRDSSLDGPRDMAIHAIAKAEGVTQ